MSKRTTVQPEISSEEKVKVETLYFSKLVEGASNLELIFALDYSSTSKSFSGKISANTSKATRLDIKLLEDEVIGVVNGLLKTDIFYSSNCVPKEAIAKNELDAHGNLIFNKFSVKETDMEKLSQHFAEQEIISKDSNKVKPSSDAASSPLSALSVLATPPEKPRSPSSTCLVM